MIKAHTGLLLWGALASLSVLSACAVHRSIDENASLQKESIRTVVVTKITSQRLNREVRLPADLLAFQDVMIYPKVDGFIDWIGVDRGSAVKKGQLLIRMTAPELRADAKQTEQQSTATAEDASQAAQ